MHACRRLCRPAAVSLRRSAATAAVSAAPPGGGGEAVWKLLPVLAGDKVPLEEAMAIRETVRQQVGPDHPAVAAADAAVERSALLHRVWSDKPFQDGQEENDRLLADLEARYVAAASSTDGLKDAGTLGMGVDLVGAYVKNYKLHRADALATEVLPHCRERGGAWVVKALNHIATLRMKQRRGTEALAIVREISQLMPYTEEELPGAWELIHRNLAMGLLGLRDYQGALVQLVKAAKVKGSVSWWDRWDMGFAMAMHAYSTRDAPLLRRAASAIAQAIPEHAAAEPGEKVMHAKIHHGLGDAYLLLGMLHDAEAGLQRPAEGAADPTVEVTALVAGGELVPVLTKEEYLGRAEVEFEKACDLFSAAVGEEQDLSGGAFVSLAFTRIQLGDAGRRRAVDAVHAALLSYTKVDEAQAALLARALEMALSLRQDPPPTWPADGARPFDDLLPEIADLVGRLPEPLSRSSALCAYRASLLLCTAPEGQFAAVAAEAMRRAARTLRPADMERDGVVASVVEAIGGLAPDVTASAPPPQRPADWSVIFEDMRRS